MKLAEKKKPISTTPKGAWEGGVYNLKKENEKSKSHAPNTTDLQGNGYPISGTSNQAENRS